MSWGRVAIAVAAATIAGCGGSQSRGSGGGDGSGFTCHERWASYLVVGSLAGPEVGVAMDCGEVGPRLRRWVVTQDGSRDERARSMTPGEFDDIWGRIDGAGWRFLDDCDTADSADSQSQGKRKGKSKSKKARGRSTDPVYTFDVKDWNGAVSFSCTGRGALPFPYGGLVDELDQAAGTLRANPGAADDDDEVDGR
jgi:hypothetical protein